MFTFSESTFPLFNILSGILAVFVFSATVLLFYNMFFFLRLLFFSPENQAVKSFLPGVSVLICARNAREELEKLLPALQNQDYPDFEIIVVDDRSDDPTYDFLLDWKAKDKGFKLVRINFTPDHTNSKKYALTMGIKAARHELLLFTDADCVPVSDLWIREMVANFDNEKEIVLAYAPYQRHPGLLNQMIRFDTFFTAVQCFSFALAGMPYMGVGRNLAYKQSLFFKLKGFYKHVNLTGGDDDLFVNRAANPENTAICLSVNSQTISEPKTTWQTWYKQKLRHWHIGKFYKSRDRFVLGLLHVCRILYWISFFLIIAWIPFNIIAGGLFFVERIVWIAGMSKIKNLLGEKISWWKMPFLDFIHTILFFVIGLKAYFSKKVSWS